MNKKSLSEVSISKKPRFKHFFRSMKLTTLLLFVAVFCLHAENTHSQNARITINQKNTQLENILEEIEKQTDYLFVYNKQVDVNRKVTLRKTDVPLVNVLDNLFNGTDISYAVEGSYIILSIKKADTTGLDKIQQAGRRVQGKVTDTNGEPLIGVTVSLKGSTKGTITNIDGEFSLEVPTNNAVLQFSFISYLSQEMAIDNKNNIHVTLQDDILQLDEVVVVGYGTTKRANLAGAISTADATVFQSRPVQNAANALQGQIPGLNITRTSGAPGSSPNIRVRDISSINDGSDVKPLILIDGAEGELDMLNPADIENVSVLKDGTAAIYGARAANGVIMVTTKSGQRNQRTRVSFDAYYSIKTPALMKKTTSLYEYASMGLEITDGSFTPEYTAEDLPKILAGSDEVIPNGIWGEYPKWFKSQNWRKMVVGNGAIQNYNLNISGGGERYSYLISLGYQNEKGLPKFGKDYEDRYFVRAKTNIQLAKDLDYELNLSYMAADRLVSTGIEKTPNNMWELMFKARCWQPMYNPAGNFYLFQGFSNPAQVAEERGDINKLNGTITVNNTLRWKIIDGLNLIGKIMISKRDGDESIEGKMVYERNWDDQISRLQYAPNWYQQNYRKTLDKNFSLYAEYKKNFANMHDVGVMVGTSHESSDYDYFSAQRNNYTQQEIMSLPLGSAENQQTEGKGNAWTINSFFSRLNYTLKDRYILEGILRADASSRFAKGHRWGYFPGVSAAWRLSEESFMKTINVFDNLKIRASYGEMGNQSGIGYYDYIPLIKVEASKNYPFGNGVKGQLASPDNMVSTTRTWETVSTTNIGLDFGLLQNRLYGTLEYFWKTNKNMLIPVTYPLVLGADAPRTNNGRLEVKGWEVTLGWRDNIGDFNYSVRGTLSDARNKVIEKGGIDERKIGRNELAKGYPINSYFGYEFDGIIQNEQQLEEYKARFPNGGVPGSISVGDAMYKDLDGDGILSVSGDGTKGAGDVIYLGDRNPRYSFGFNFTGEYKGFDLSFFLQGVGKRTTFLEGSAKMPFEQSWWESLSYWYGKTWTPDRTDAKYPAITLQDKRNYNYNYSTNTKRNAAYVRLKNLQFGYTLPQNLVSRLKLQKMRLYVSGEDLFEIHKVPGGWDPESDSEVWDYPFTRNFSVGVNLVF